METKKIRVAITGLGVVSPLGNDVPSTWQAIIDQKVGIDHIRHFDASRFPTTIAAEVKDFSFDLQGHASLQKHSVEFVRMGLSAAEQAFEDASLRPCQSDAERWGVVVGGGMMTTEFEYWERFSDRYIEDQVLDLNRLGADADNFFSVNDFAKATVNSGIGLLQQHYGIRGYANTVHSACASGGQALGLALQVIRRGEADCVLAGGYDSMVNPIGLANFCLLGALSTYNDTPQTASRPFDLTRNGFVLGEGAAFLVLESWAHAIRRKARIYAELAGEGNSLSSYRITDSHPNGDGARQAIQWALQDARADLGQVDYINAHGTSTKMNDLSEANAIKAVFGSGYKDVLVSSTKAQTGHLIAAAGAIEAVFSTLAIHTGQLPVMVNLSEPDPDCDLAFVTPTNHQRTVRLALSNSFGFGGANSCLAFRNPQAVPGGEHD
jgi:3-oxoacyl-[acyl-carrier-protein] synthase-1